MRVTVSESWAGELDDLDPQDALKKAEKGLCGALEELGLEDAAEVIRGRLGALLDAERQLTRCASLRKALPARGGELDVVSILAERMGGAYDSTLTRLVQAVEAEIRGA
tara:strand:+ start:851 stop:1177 length:327 start_codon:yes stop_codon:yes gene_type:complete